MRNNTKGKGPEKKTRLDSQAKSKVPFRTDPLQRLSNEERTVEGGDDDAEITADQLFVVHNRSRKKNGKSIPSGGFVNPDVVVQWESGLEVQTRLAKKLLESETRKGLEDDSRGAVPRRPGKKRPLKSLRYSNKRVWEKGPANALTSTETARMIGELASKTGI